MTSEYPGFELKIERLRAHRTQRSLAIQVGIAPQTLSDYECGYRDLPVEIVTRLHAALNKNRNADVEATR